MGRSIATAAVMAAIVTFVATTPGQAQSDYPNRVVKIVNPFGAGSAPDILVRALSTGLANGLGQQFIVENRVGGSGAVGTASVVRADADGYTLLFARRWCCRCCRRRAAAATPATNPTRSFRCARPSSTRWGWWCGRIRRSRASPI